MSSMTKTVDFEEKLLNLLYTCCDDDFTENIKCRYNIKTKYNIFGSLSSYDPSKPLDRKAAASAIHCFLLNALEEEDEGSIEPAFELADIYECRVCSLHIAQVYCKGIMEAREKCDDNSPDGGCLYFDLNSCVDEKQQEMIIERIFDRSKRKRPVSFGHEAENEKVRHIGLNELKLSRAFFIDIRSRSEYSLGSVYDGINIPMDDLIKNPYSPACGINTPVVLWSDDPERSSITAKCLIEAGYKNVAVLDAFPG